MIISLPSNEGEKMVLNKIRKSLGFSKKEFVIRSRYNEYSYEEQVEAIIVPCGLCCSLEICGRRFSALRRWIDRPILIIRPLILSPPCQMSDSFALSFLNKEEVQESRNAIYSRILDSPSCSCSPSWPVHPSRPLYKIAKTQFIISQECEKSHSLSGLSMRIGWSPTWLSHAFKIRAGMGLEEYAIQVSLCFALWKIVNSECLIKKIAHDLGYTDPQYFSNIFKKRFGISPSMIRRGTITNCQQNASSYSNGMKL